MELRRDVTADPLIAARSVTKRFGRGRRSLAALHGVDIAVPRGGVCGLVGPNGAGKSTFIKLALGFIGADAGELSLLGMAPGDPRALRRLGYLPENPAYPHHLTGREFLHYVGRLLGLERRRLRASCAALLDEVGIAHAADRPIRGYSKGMTQRLGLAQALLGNPELLILDEPMTGLDPIGRVHVKDMLRRRREAGATIVFCSHILEDVEQLSDEVIMLARGEVRFRGSIMAIVGRGADTWSALLHCATLPGAIAAGAWSRVGPDLWSGRGLSREVARAIQQASLEGTVQLVQLRQEVGDLEQMFIRVAADSGSIAHA